ncbi:MAG: GNAT family N-acetyltransferase [Candidatus Hodarchaeales archaeon]
MRFQIENYDSQHEDQWLECLKETFYDSLYYDTMLKFKPRYEQPIVELVTLHGEKIVAFLDIEMIPPTEQLCRKDEAHCGQITLIGVHPDYRRKNLGTNLLEYAIKHIKNKFKATRLEVSFREDEGIYRWFHSMKFLPCDKYYEVSFSQDFFIKYGIELPFGINPSVLTGFVDQEGFRYLTTDHPPEKSYSYLIMEKIL